MPVFVKVAQVADIPPGSVREIKIQRYTIALANVDGRFYAVDNECLHQGGPLAEGELSGELIECPWHFWQWNMLTGECAHDPAFKLRCYEVKVEGDDILIAV